MNLVVNEWLVEFLIPGADAGDKARLQRFLDKFLGSPAQIVIGRQTPLTQKFYRYLKRHGTNHVYKRNAIKLRDLVLYDPSRTQIVENDSLVMLPPDRLSGIHNDDWYLLHLANTVPDSIVVSVDTRLIRAVTDSGVVRIIHLDDYLDA
jgi:hypothetical protein